MRTRFAAVAMVVLAVGILVGAGATAAAQEEAGSVSDCAATPPDDFEDPDEDVVGWADGYWYDEPVEIDQQDGLNDSELDALVSRTMARVEAIRCLQFTERVPVTIATREELREEVRRMTVDDELQTFDNVRYESLFLVDGAEDSVDVQTENRGEAVLGYYDPAENEIVVVSEDEERLQLDELTLAHELMHALQDQQFDLGRFHERTLDGSLAQDGLIEGDAHYVEHRYAERCFGGDWNGTCIEQDVGEGAAGGGDDLANIGVYFITFQPYSDGPAFVRHVYRDDGWSAVNELYDEPPRSAAQIIHPERYGDGGPQEIALEDRHGDEWERVRPDDHPDHGRLGQAALASMLVYPTYHSQGETQIVPAESWLNVDDDGEIDEFDPLNYDHRYTTGWDGDRLHAYRNDDGDTAYVWRIAWESEDDAETFLEGYRELLEYWNAERLGENAYEIAEAQKFSGGYYVERNGSTVTIVNAPTVDGLPSVHADAAPDRSNAEDVETGRDDDSGLVDTGGQPGFGILLAIGTLIGLLAGLRHRYG